MPYCVIAEKEAHADPSFDFVTIGATPFNELPLSLKSSEEQLILQCSIYIEQLERTFGEPIKHSSFFILKGKCQEGIVYEAAIMYMTANENAQNYALTVEQGDAYWDEKSLQRLIENKLTVL